MYSPAKWLAGLVVLMLAGAAGAAETLPSWNEGAAKQGIVAFVDAVTRQGSKDFVPATERIAVFDNDGTLWSEQPIYVQFAFMLDQVRAAAPKHPEWQDNARSRRSRRRPQGARRDGPEARARVAPARTAA